MKKPLFITFEGGEGSGKTTQSKRLYEYLLQNDVKAIWTREPGGTKVSESIRELIFTSDLEIETESLLISAARIEHVKKLILPALSDGYIVICDRFIDSSLCYQGYKINPEWIMDIHRKFVNNLMPDITFFIDVPVKIGLDRAGKRGGNNKFESMPIELHEIFRQKFLKLNEEFDNRIIKIDGTLSEDEIFNIIKTQVYNEK